MSEETVFEDKSKDCGGEMASHEDVPVVLVADDDQDMLGLVVRHLETIPCRIITANDGEKALALARRELPDLMIIDVMMPGKSGWEVCKEVRHDAALKDTGVIVVTGIGERLNAMTSELYGADASIDKPFELDELDEKIKKVLERKAKVATKPAKGTSKKSKSSSK